MQNSQHCTDWHLHLPTESEKPKARGYENTDWPALVLTGVDMRVEAVITLGWAGCWDGKCPVATRCCVTSGVTAARDCAFDALTPAQCSHLFTVSPPSITKVKQFVLYPQDYSKIINKLFVGGVRHGTRIKALDFVANPDQESTFSLSSPKFMNYGKKPHQKAFQKSRPLERLYLLSPY